MAEPAAKIESSSSLEVDLKRLGQELQPMIDLRSRLHKLQDATEKSGGLILKVEEVGMCYDVYQESVKGIDRYLGILLIRYGLKPDELVFIERVRASTNKLKAMILDSLMSCSEILLEKSVTDMMDESFSRLMEIHQRNEPIFTRNLFLDILMKFIQSKAEPQLRESMQLLNVYINMSIVDRYKTVILKLKRHNTMYTHLKDRFEKYLSNFRFALEMEGTKSIPIRVLNNADNTALVNQSIVGRAGQFFQDRKMMASTSTHDLVTKHNTSEFHLVNKERDDSGENDFFPVNLSLLKSYASENELGSFLRVANLLLYQVQMKINSAIELYSLEDVLSKGFKEFLKLLKIPHIKRVMDEQPSVKNLVIQRLVSLFYSVGNAIQGKLSNDNEVSMYSIIAKLFIIEKKLGEAFPDQSDLAKFYSLHIDTFFAFTLKRFTKIIRDKSAYFFDLYLTNHSDNFRRLDLFNKELNEVLAVDAEKKIGEDGFYQRYNEYAKNRRFFGENTYKQHYMVPFHIILQRVSKSTKGSTIWAVKAVIYEMLLSFMKKKKYINFLGYLSLILNLDAFLHEVTKEFTPAFLPMLGSIGELRFLKHFFYKLVYHEAQMHGPKKTSAVYVHSKKVKITYDMMGSGEGFIYEQLLVTKADKLEMPSTFNPEVFYDSIAFNEIVS